MSDPGQKVGPYILLSRLGKGGFGEVWLAEKRSQFLTKKVAVKLPHDEQVNFEAIRQEAVLWEQASGHANVLPIIDADIYDDQIVIVSEYASGGSLHERIQRERVIPTQQAVELSMGILNGLDYLHGKRIIHRDIKPQNVLLQGDTPRLADFGISRAMQTTAISLAIAGTDAYMSPESFDGKRSVQTDIWSVGVVLYQMISGRLPFPQEHPSERMFAILTKDFEPLTNEVPTFLKNVITKALAKDPDSRYASAAEMRIDLQRGSAGLARTGSVMTEIMRAGTRPSSPTEALAPQMRNRPPAVTSGLPHHTDISPSAPSESPVPLAGYHEISPNVSRKKMMTVMISLAAGVGLITVALVAALAANWTALFGNANLQQSTVRTDVPAAATPSVAPSVSPTLDQSPTPTPTPDVNGTYVGSGALRVSDANARGFSFTLGAWTRRTGDCGEISGKALWTSPNTVGSFEKIPDWPAYNDANDDISYKKKCKLTIRFSNGKAKVSEDGYGCLYYHGASCEFSGTYVLSGSK